MSECSQGAIERAERAIQKLLERAKSVPSIESDIESEIESDSETEKKEKPPLPICMSSEIRCAF